MNVDELGQDDKSVDNQYSCFKNLIPRSHNQLAESPLVNNLHRGTFTPVSPENELIQINSMIEPTSDAISPLHDHLGYAKPTHLVKPVICKQKTTNILGKRGRPIKKDIVKNDEHGQVVMTEEMKRDERRRKNNEASKVSRAKRKKRQSDCAVEEIELSKRNEELKVEMEDISRQCRELKSKLFAALTSKK